MKSNFYFLFLIIVIFACEKKEQNISEYKSFDIFNMKAKELRYGKEMPYFKVFYRNNIIDLNIYNTDDIKKLKFAKMTNYYFYEHIKHENYKEPKFHIEKILNMYIYTDKKEIYVTRYRYENDSLIKFFVEIYNKNLVECIEIINPNIAYLPKCNSDIRKNLNIDKLIRNNDNISISVIDWELKNKSINMKFKDILKKTNEIDETKIKDLGEISYIIKKDFSFFFHVLMQLSFPKDEFLDLMQ